MIKFNDISVVTGTNIISENRSNNGNKTTDNSKIDNTKKTVQYSDGANVEISGEGMELAKANNVTDSMLDSFEQQLENAKESGKDTQNLGKLMKIARRIANGDKVPPTDEKKLMEYNSKLYQAAKAAAMLNYNKEHKKYKSEFEDEEDKEFRDKVRGLDNTAQDDTINESTEVDNSSEL